jgi:hypothetical protein
MTEPEPQQVQTLGGTPRMDSPAEARNDMPFAPAASIR